MDENTKGNNSDDIQCLELQVLSQKERRERCFVPERQQQRLGPSIQQLEEKRNDEIRQFLALQPSAHSSNGVHHTKQDQAQRKRSRVYRFVADVDGDPISVTSALTGDRVYCSRSESNRQTERASETYPPLDSSLIDRIREKMAETAIETKQSDAMADSRKLLIPWVIKYAPKSFSDLVTDDKINRELVKWLKAWKPKKEKKELSDRRRESATTTKTPRSSISNKKATNKITDFFTTANDAAPASTTTPTVSQRPIMPSSPTLDHRVLILCGHWGVGKTCLVDIAVRMCGYEPFVIDSSHDRSPDALSEQLRTLLECSCLDSKKARKCVIFDEIDTMPPGAESRQSIQRIVDFVEGRYKKHGFLTKPMIFICNELYTAYLAPLRPLAKILTISQPKINKSVVSRLQKICQWEDVSIELPELHRLIEENGNDMTACLNALEFRSHCDVMTVTGTKMMKTTPFQIWDSILTPARDKRSSMDALKLYESFDAHELILRGIAWNYTRLHLQDAMLQKTTIIASRIAQISRFLHRVPNYCPSMLVGLRSIFAQANQSVKIEWPKEEFQSSRQHYINSEALNAFRNDCALRGSVYLSRDVWVLDVLPYLTQMSQTGMSVLQLAHTLNGECKQKLFALIKSSTNTVHASPRIQSKRRASVQNDTNKKQRFQSP